MHKKEKKSTQLRKYDIIRKEETIKKLRVGIQQIKRQRGNQEGKPISVYKLSKHTGVHRDTIRKCPEIMDILKKDMCPGIPMKNATVKVDRIYSIEEAVSIINQLTGFYNAAKDNYNDSMKKNSALNLEIVRLKCQVEELSRQLKKYTEKY